MYYNHGEFDIPDDETVVWRYMDFDKFEDLIQSRQLYFPRLDRMGDLTEGIFPTQAQEKIIKFLIDKKRDDDLQSFEQIVNPRHRLNNFVSCWNIAGHESYLLWKSYTKDASAIAMKSTVGRLKQALNDDHDYEIYMGKVRYHNNEDFIFRGNMYNLVMQKSAYYQPENELRIISNNISQSGRKSDVDFNKVKVDLNILIDEIYISPKATQDHKTQVEGLLYANNLRKSVLVSGINDKWLHSS